MGSIPGITIDTMPPQSALLGKRVEVCFHFDTSKTLLGTLVRDDLTSPSVRIILCDDGRALLTTECQFRLLEP